MEAVNWFDETADESSELLLVPEDRELKSVQEGVAALESIRGRIAKVEAVLTALQKQELELSSQVIPTMMAGLGISALKLIDGRKLSIKESVNASVQADQLAAARSWLTEHGFEDLCKAEFKAGVGKGEENKLASVIAAAQAAGVDGVVKTFIHPQTLGAFVRERLAHGDELPPEIFRVFVAKQTIIK